jgi:hypothetical protein
MPRANVRHFLHRGEIKFKCSWQCLKTCVPPKSPYCITDALLNAASGNINNGFVFIGSHAYRCEKYGFRERIDGFVKSRHPGENRGPDIL